MTKLLCLAIAALATGCLDPDYKEISIDATPVIEMQAGHIIELDAYAQRADGQIDEVSSIVTWRSTNPSVATVTDDGLVTVIQPGTTHICVVLGDIGTTRLIVAQ